MAGQVGLAHPGEEAQQVATARGGVLGVDLLVFRPVVSGVDTAGADHPEGAVVRDVVLPEDAVRVEEREAGLVPELDLVDEGWEHGGFLLGGARLGWGIRS